MKKLFAFAIFCLSVYIPTAEALERIFPDFNLQELEVIKKWENETAPKICPWVFTIGGSLFAFSSEYNATLFWNWAVRTYGMAGFTATASPVGWGLFAAGIAAPVGYAAGYGVCTMLTKGRLEADIARAIELNNRAVMIRDEIAKQVIEANNKAVAARKDLLKF